jgi:glycosyltransferase involved in cell wall biosynthesis/GT2 family glycosyltransferase
MRIGFLEPHLRRYGGIRRILEFSNRLVARGHQVTIYVPTGEPLRCDWMTCRARIRHIPDGFTDRLDVLVFNHEPHWYLTDLFENADRTVFYALHHGALYNKEGSWEAVRSPVDRILANSRWTADQIAAEVGVEPTVVLGGINPEHFRPLDVPKRYPVLSVGDRRWWKGTELIEEAVGLLGLPLETYAGKDLSQDRMAAEYSAAEVFVVGSRFEGFGQPGLEALACGTPLVTTDNGGSREYAVDGETALVVPTSDPAAMAEAIRRLQVDRSLAQRLTANGLRLVAERFDWEARTDDLETVLGEIVTGRRSHPSAAPVPNAGADSPLLSVIVLAWDQLLYTQRCVETIRRHTDVPYELIVVDNGSAWEARHYAERAADEPVLHMENRGFAAGMNAGLAAASGRYVAFCNNDTEFPQDWASRLIEAHGKFSTIGITVPAVTEARNGRTVRSEPGDTIEVLDPFEAPPAAVVYLMDAATARELGGWSEEFPVASGEDIDLAFRVWVNDLDIVFDTRVVVDHIGKGTAAVKIGNWRELWDANGRILLEKWTSSDIDVVRLDSCDPVRWERNLRTARAVAGWMDKYFTTRRRGAKGTKSALWSLESSARGLLVRFPSLLPVAMRVWRLMQPILPRRWSDALRSRLGYEVDRAVMVQPPPRNGLGEAPRR